MSKKKIELKVCFGDKKSAVMKTAAGVAGVVEVKIDGDKLIVIGEVDPAKLTAEIKKIGTEACYGFVKRKELSVEILSVEKVEDKKKEESKCCCEKPCDCKNCCHGKCDCKKCCNDKCKKCCDEKCKKCCSSCKKDCCKKLIVCPKPCYDPCVINPCINPCNYRGYYQSSPMVCYDPCYDNYGGSDCSIV